MAPNSSPWQQVGKGRSTHRSRKPDGNKSSPNATNGSSTRHPQKHDGDKPHPKTEEEWVAHEKKLLEERRKVQAAALAAQREAKRKEEAEWERLGAGGDTPGNWRHAQDDLPFDNVVGCASSNHKIRKEHRRAYLARWKGPPPPPARPGPPPSVPAALAELRAFYAPGPRR